MIYTTETKYLIFKKQKIGIKKTFDVWIYNKSDELLGNIYWRPGWRTYVFNPVEDMELDTKCLDDINNYIKELIEERKKETVKSAVASAKKNNENEER